MHASCEQRDKVPLQTLCAAPEITAHDNPLKNQLSYALTTGHGKPRSRMQGGAARVYLQTARIVVPGMQLCFTGAGQLMTDAHGFRVSV